MWRRKKVPGTGQAMPGRGGSGMVIFAAWPRQSRRRIVLRVIVRLTALAFVAVALQWTGLAPAVAATAIQIVPHKALYRLSLKGASRNNGVSAVGGKMAFELRDACDGWAVNQRNLMLLENAQGFTRRVGSSMTTWEANDGSAFRFIVNKDYRAGGDEVFAGRAERDPSGAAMAIFTAPDEVEIKLPVDVMFPVQHTIALLERIAVGEKFFSVPLFDGSELEAAGFVSAAIGLETVPEAAEGPLISGPYWPVRLAFFRPENNIGIPDYELAVDLHENGIARRLEIHFEEFTVDVSLQQLERLERVGC